MVFKVLFPYIPPVEFKNKLCSTLKENTDVTLCSWEQHFLVGHILGCIRFSTYYSKTKDKHSKVTVQTFCVNSSFNNGKVLNAHYKFFVGTLQLDIYLEKCFTVELLISLFAISVISSFWMALLFSCQFTKQYQQY